MRSKKAFTFIEIMVAIAALAIVVIGTAGYRYYSALDMRRATMHLTAGRLALTLNESWKGAAGSEYFDPVGRFTSVMSIQQAESGPDVPEGLTVLDYYKIVVEENTYYATLSYQDMAEGLRALNVVISWDRYNSAPDSDSEIHQSYTLTTCAMY